MSQGMWTKHFTAEGLVFFYNASLNQSVWHPPENGIVHIAPYLGYESAPAAQYSHTGHDTNALFGLELTNADDAVKTALNETSELSHNGATNLTSAETNVVRAKGNTSKRFKSNQNNEESNAGNLIESSYLRQKAELEAMMGCKKDDSSKWLVR